MDSIYRAISGKSSTRPIPTSPEEPNNREIIQTPPMHQLVEVPLEPERTFAEASVQTDPETHPTETCEEEISLKTPAVEVPFTVGGHLCGYNEAGIEGFDEESFSVEEARQNTLDYIKKKDIPVLPAQDVSEIRRWLHDKKRLLWKIKQMSLQGVSSFGLFHLERLRYNGNLSNLKKLAPSINILGTSTLEEIGLTGFWVYTKYRVVSREIFVEIHISWATKKPEGYPFFFPTE